ncbi:hypothetical protein BAX95_06375 [Elizabethkingia meningoseptica]|uniref:hypothetical protein n=1 Tax=Elizabethkingia meningoseptica TaxID=238 RepID=UPI000999DD01|nr:hypothetical protein [Elizabethkingia meningoseptica]OPC23499.1 hypothetical protein BAX95_06375 [Elizabethkingia meningoseptica]
MKETISVKIIEDANKIDWEPWVLIVAILALIASVIIPFAQKKYEEFGAKRNFQYYLKKQIGLMLNHLTMSKIEYNEPSVRNEPKKEYLLIKDFIVKIKSDFSEHKNTVQPRVIFMMLMNIQNLCLFAYQARKIISTIDLQNITERTLEFGKELSKKELNKIYGLILIYESFQSISLFHDRFNEMKSITRLIEENEWSGLKVEKELLSNQNKLNDDLLLLNDNEKSLEELSNIILILNRETKKYFDYDKLQQKRKSN